MSTDPCPRCPTVQRWGSALELGHALVGPAQAAAAFQGAHGHGDLRGLQARDHRRHAPRIRIGAMGQQGAVQGHEFVSGLRAVAEQRLAVTGGGVHLQQHVRELNAADGVVDALACAYRLGLIRQCRDGRLVEHSVGADLDLAAHLGLCHRSHAGYQVGQQGLQEFGRGFGHAQQLKLLVPLHRPLRRRDEHLVSLPKAQRVVQPYAAATQALAQRHHRARLERPKP